MQDKWLLFEELWALLSSKSLIYLHTREVTAAGLVLISPWCYCESFTWEGTLIRSKKKNFLSSLSPSVALSQNQTATKWITVRERMEYPELFSSVAYLINHALSCPRHWTIASQCGYMWKSRWATRTRWRSGWLSASQRQWPVFNPDHESCLLGVFTFPPMTRFSPWAPVPSNTPKGMGTRA